MYRIILFIVLLLVHDSLLFAQRITNPHGIENTGTTPRYDDVRRFYEELANRHTTVQVHTVGPTDTDDSLLVVYYSSDSKFDIPRWKKQDKLIIFINNGIHPGEPDGIIASMQLLWDITQQKIRLPDNVVLAIIPVFNISGARSLRQYTRANQNGPAITGFRGNAQNLDLNRDFVKMDARETRSIVRLFHMLDPDVLVDNHVSNGADYQHVMTLLSTQCNKLGGPMGDYLNRTFEPALYDDMKQRGFDLLPYVNVWGNAPDNGWDAFMEIPRFFSGFAAMFHTYAFVAETHMLKPFPVRVKSTYELMLSIIEHTSANAATIRTTRKQQKQWVANSTALAIDWGVDTTQPTSIELKGYEAGYKTSDISGQPRLFYDRSKPFINKIPFYNTCTTKQKTDVPQAYVIPQGWNKVVTRLKANGVKMRKLKADTTIELTVYYITDYKTTPNPYEGHYLHSGVEVDRQKKQVQLKKGDYYIPISQDAKRYLVETLEPTAPDAFFAWGFFDAVLQQKEYYSDYAFEDLAVELLAKDKSLRDKLEQRKAADPVFAKDGKAQLHFVFQNSPYHEPEHMRYPVYRLE